MHACTFEFQDFWAKSLSLVEFSYNNNYNASVQMDPYEALYGRKNRSLTCWSDISEDLVLGSELVQETVKKVKAIPA